MTQETNTSKLNFDYDVDLNRITYNVLYTIREQNEKVYNELLKLAFEEVYNKNINEELPKNITLEELIKKLEEKDIIGKWEEDMIPMESDMYNTLLENIEDILNEKEIDFNELTYQQEEENQTDEELIELVTEWYLQEVVNDLLENWKESKLLNKDYLYSLNK